MSVTTKQIITESAEIKAFIEKHNKLPLTNTINNKTYNIYTTSYLMSKLVLNNCKDTTYNTPSITKYNVTQHKDTINEEVYKSDYLDMIKRFVKYCESNHKVPSTIHTKNTNVKASFELYTYCISKIIVFYNKNKYLPNYCTFNKKDLQNANTTTSNTKKETSKSTSTNTKTTNSTKKSATKNNNCTNPYTSTPHYHEHGCNKLGQCTPYWCGPHSIHQAIRKFGITQYSEKQIAAWAGSTTSGTDHNGINTAIAKISKLTGKKLTVKWVNFSDLGKTTEERFTKLGKIICQPNKALITHIKYINGGQDQATSTNKGFGHYEGIDKINTKTKYVRALNSLDTKKSDGSYTGVLQDRTFKTEASYLAYTPGGQKAICIITLG